ncbi:MAG: hypothetical protein BBJ57_07525 [Desulfobacterales bacterium PC51MH44]|nr:MAG: hypothetical protein BBJ57_07525 [Desulfobacterales bacterium PC51MH44]
MDFEKADRDMLIRHDQKLSSICESMVTMGKTLTDIHGSINNGAVVCVERRASCRKEVTLEINSVATKIDEKVGKYFTKTILRWIFTFIIAGLVGLGVYTSDTRTITKVNEQKITNHHEYKYDRN